MPDFRKTLSNALQIFVALVYLQTLYFKFSAHPDSVYIFSTLGIEPAGRILVGILEGITAALILIPKTRLPGAILSIGVISGAILAHLGPLGIEVNEDDGSLFLLAVLVFIASLAIVFLRLEETRLLVQRVSAIFRSAR
ncbi:MAG: DoxX family protein [Saprospiraceae bacterium]|nr:DoxX family protein [Saprospiraceae bacterium]